MRRKLCIFLVFTILLLLFSAFALADPIGFGYVNNTDVALRRGIGGKTIVRLPENTCVWIKESATDAKGIMWYHINAGLNIDHTNTDYSGWMKAEFINAGNQVWHDVVAVSASGGMMALRSDGTCETISRPIVSRDGSGWILPRGWDQSFTDVKQVLSGDWGMMSALITADGTFHSTKSSGKLQHERLRIIGIGNDLFGITADNRLVQNAEISSGYSWIYPANGMDDLSHIVKLTGNEHRLLLLSENGDVYALDAGDDLERYPEPDWPSWTDVVSLDAYACSLSRSSARNINSFAAVRADGTVLAAPQQLADLIGDWTGMQSIELNANWVLGLRKDGIAVTVGLCGAIPPDVSGWTDVVSISAGLDFCVGIKMDGTLIFAGEHIFMGEGHNRQ